MLNTIKKLFGDESARALKPLWPIVTQINELEEGIKALSDEELKAKTDEFKRRLNPPEGRAETLDDILPEAFAVVREAARRTLGERHFDVQLLGGIVLHRGNIAEMRTGEGKTLVGTLPTYLNALTGNGVHIVTVNDYLSRRDAVWMGQIYHFLGLQVGAVNTQVSYLYDPARAESLDKERDEKGSFKVVDDYLREVARPEAYAADITYGTDSEFGFDYLRDNMEQDATRLRQRGFNFVIIDEIDSILIDEARTPLIISVPAAESEQLYQTFTSIARQMKVNEDYEVDEKMKAISLTDDGISKAERLLGVDNIYTEKGIKYVHHLETAVRAKALFERDTDYVVRDGEVVIVDQFTGRLQPGRRWSEGLHQAIEAKEGIETKHESRTAASITYQNYFRMYPKIAGMTGTAITSAEEFRKVYNIDTLEIPTNNPIQRKDLNDFILQTEAGKLKAIARTVKERHDKGQPVLIGTISIEKNEILSEYLKAEGVPHKMLNAKNHESEGGTIAQAGQKGAVTVATNMAGRGVDIKLGGSPTTPELAREVKDLGGLYVLGTERHEARRIDDQLRGRAGRQGDPGETQFFVSLEDRLMRVFASDRIKGMMGRFGIAEDEHIENRMITRAIESAQRKIEGLNFDARKRILDFDNILDHQRKTVYSQRRTILTGDLEMVKLEVARLMDGAREDVVEMIEKRQKELGEEAFYTGARKVVLQTIDMLWVEHLEVMDHLRNSVNLRAYGQHDPLTEYKKEGVRLFSELQESIENEVLKSLMNLEGENIAMGGFGKTVAQHQDPSQVAAVNTTGTPPEGSSQLPPVSRGLQRPSGKSFGRNEKVILVKDGEEMEIKYKKADPYFKQGWRIKSK
ncbi:MAG: preprotein translocase subunit SecA [Candidatus Paceibacterota bacterium]